MISTCRLCHATAAPTPPTINPGKPLILLSRPSLLDARLGHQLSGTPGHFLASSLQKFCQIRAFSVLSLASCATRSLPAETPEPTALANCRMNLLLQLQIANPVAILALGEGAKNALLKTKKVKYGFDALLDRFPVYATFGPEIHSQTSRLLEFHEDLNVFSRILYWRFLHSTAQIFNAKDFSIIIKASMMRELFISGKIHTDKYKEAINA